jgi:hypothetical protein
VIAEAGRKGIRDTGDAEELLKMLQVFKKKKEKIVAAYIYYCIVRYSIMARV